MMDALLITGSTAMTKDSLQVRILRYALLDPIDDARDILRRLQNNEAFRHYLWERRLRALPLVVGIVLASLACAGAALALALIMHAGALLELVAILAIAPIVLVGSFSVQAHVLLSWLEGRSLAKLQKGSRPRDRGRIGRWLVRRFRIELGPLPQVPWIPALVFFLLPVAILASVSAPVAAGLVAFQIVAAIIYARQDPVSGVDYSPARREVEAPKSFAAAPLRKAPKGADDLDFTPTVARLGTASWARHLRSFVQSGFRSLRFLVERCLDNLLPFIEYCALVGGIFAVAAGRKSASEQDVALGMLLIGAALLLAGMVSIVTQRMSFRFYGSARAGYAGATALITGMMQVIVGGLAVATAHALATDVWQSNLDALLANPWPLLIPLGLLLVGAGLLLVRRPSSYVGPIGTMLFVLPKTLTGIAALGAGAAILVGWAWNIYDPQAFRSFVRLLPDEDMNLLANWWSAAIALLR
jgi:hypothetical protein